MKRFVPIFISTICILARVSAQEDSVTVKTPEISLAGGISFPYLPEDSRHFYKTGWNAGAGYGYAFSPGTVGYSSLYIAGEYARFAFDVTGYLTNQNLLQKNLSLSRNPTTAFNVMVGYKGTFLPSGRLPAPYFLIGIGYIHVTEGTITASGDSSFTISGRNISAFAWSAGVGIEVPVTQSVRVFVQGKSVLGVSDPARQYFPLSAGLSYRFGN